MSETRLPKLLAVLVLGSLGLFLLLGRFSQMDDAEVTTAVLRASREDVESRHLEITYPRPGTLFPSDIVAPTFLWQDSSKESDTWLVLVRLDGKDNPRRDLTRQQQWRPSPEAWATIKHDSLLADARVTVIGVRRSRPDRVVSRASITIRTSPDEVGAPIFYRDVPLPFIEAIKEPEAIRWRLGEVSSRQPPRVMLENLPVCGNCHSFSRDGTTLGMDVDYASDKGSYAIASVEEETVLSPDRIITWSDFRREDGEQTFGLLSRVSPDGRYVISTVRDRSVFVPRNDLAYSQLFFPIKGILAVYDRESGEFSSLPGADDPRYVQSNPVWSPDGKTIVFARAPAVDLGAAERSKRVLLSTGIADEFLKEGRQFKYDLFRVPFNGGAGGACEPITGASGNGLSNYFPSLSPDGKWLVFTRAKNFMLLQPDSRLCIIPAEGGTVREMACNTPHMNSWHSWSPNGKWIVFSSKARGPYTQLYLTHVDENGNDTPPVLIENMALPGRAANIPEFVNRSAPPMKRIVERFVNDVNLARQGDELRMTNEFKRAAKYYERSLALNPDNLEVRKHLADCLMEIGKYQRSGQELATVLAKDPSHLGALRTFATLYRKEERYPEMFDTYEAIFKLAPTDASAYRNLGNAHWSLGDTGKAEQMFRKALQIAPRRVELHLLLGQLLRADGRNREASEHFHTVLKSCTQDAEFGLGMAALLINDPEFRQEVVAVLHQILLDQPKLGPPHALLARIHLEQGDFDAALLELEEAVRLGGVSHRVHEKLRELRSRKGPADAIAPGERHRVDAPQAPR